MKNVSWSSQRFAPAIQKKFSAGWFIASHPSRSSFHWSNFRGMIFTTKETRNVVIKHNRSCIIFFYRSFFAFFRCVTTSIPEPICMESTKHMKTAFRNQIKFQKSILYRSSRSVAKGINTCWKKEVWHCLQFLIYS